MEFLLIEFLLIADKKRCSIYFYYMIKTFYKRLYFYYNIN